MARRRRCIASARGGGGGRRDKGWLYGVRCGSAASEGGKPEAWTFFERSGRRVGAQYGGEEGKVSEGDDWGRRCDEWRL